ncbi:MAG TPA: YtxH domain-containing protein [Adhaeribacter sp.]|nr:YtxH domain-containing protein [Adhaeribacter sp.]
MNMGQSFKGAKKLKFGKSTSGNAARNQSQSAAKRKKNKYSTTSSSTKIWMAALAGASAGVIAGLLMAPESGRDTIDDLKRTAMRLGDQMDEQFRAAMNRLEDKGLLRSGDSLQVQGNWDKVKGRMKAEYGNLTDQDLAYLEGQEDTFLGHLETKLGKSKRELVRWINSLA